MASSVLFGKYLPIDSFVHRIDARVKIVASIIFLSGLFITGSILVLICALVFVMIISRVSKIGFIKLVKSLKPIRFLLIFMIVFNLIFIQTGEVVFEWKFITLHSDAIYRSSYFTLRMIVMILYTSVLTLTTAPLELASAIESLLKPLEKIKFPAHEIGMMISIALRFIPTLFDETELIMKAQASRGIDFVNGKIKEKIRGVISLLIPLFINSLKRASDLADSMEIRGYTGGDGRTNLNEHKFGLNELLFLTVHVIATSVVVFYKYFY